jgi:hypothetical protein
MTDRMYWLKIWALIDVSTILMAPLANIIGIIGVYGHNL